MKNNLKRILVIILSLCMLSGSIAMLTGCTGKSSDPGTFTYWLYNSVDASYYTDYAENPALQYALSHWRGEDVEEGSELKFEFWIPPAGSAVDNYNTMIASGDYADIIDFSISDGANKMFNEGIVIELTDYINDYMPNYKAYLESNPVVKNYVCFYDEEGNEHYYSIVGINDALDDTTFGYEYRRDWIVKYGVNPSTGESFTGGFVGDKTVDPYCWEDNVLFPSWYDDELRENYIAQVPDWDGSDPAYISDWEWMFEIFEKAYAELGLTDSYCMSLYYWGYAPFGQIVSAFGGGSNGTHYRTPDNKSVTDCTSDNFRTYLDCMNTWYEKGWIDQYYYERSTDMFYQIDDAKVRTGQIGLWFGSQGTLGNRLDAGDELTTDICVYSAFTPINDIYGDESSQGVLPYTYFSGSDTNMGFMISVNAEKNGKDIASLCSFIDYLYTKEGALLKNFGLSAEQQAEAQNELLIKNGLSDGCYHITEEGKYCFNDPILLDGGYLRDAVIMGKIPGLGMNVDRVSGYGELYDHMMDVWSSPKQVGNFFGFLVAKLSDEDADLETKIKNNMWTFLQTNTPDFITGKKDVNDDDVWEVYCKSLNKYGVEKLNEVYQGLFDKNPI